MPAAFKARATPVKKLPVKLPVLPSHVVFPKGQQVPLVVEKARNKAKTMKLQVRKGVVIVSVPESIRTAAPVLNFLEQQKFWLEAQWLRQGGGFARLENGDDASVALRGNAVPLVWKQGTLARAQIVGDDDEIHVWLPVNARPGVGRNVVRQLLEAELRKDIARSLNKWLPTIAGGAVSRLSLRPTDGQWGSMNRAKRLALSASLVGARPAALEYVIVHELCHQLHMDHSPSFWREVRLRCPGYESETAYLNRVGAKLNGMWSCLEG